MAGAAIACIWKLFYLFPSRSSPIFHLHTLSTYCSTTCSFTMEWSNLGDRWVSFDSCLHVYKVRNSLLADMQSHLSISTCILYYKTVHNNLVQNEICQHFHLVVQVCSLHYWVVNSARISKKSQKIIIIFIQINQISFINILHEYLSAQLLFRINLCLQRSQKNISWSYWMVNYYMDP